jgi:hypothetical protein
MITSLDEIIACPEFQKLDEIGGHKVYHLEGSALVHTMMVIREAKEMFPSEPLMWRVAALHDIGKIYTSICNGPDDWSYPDHALCGSFKGVLVKFISLQDENFRDIQWYIKNHIKPLFWMKRGVTYGHGELLAMTNDMPSENCSIHNLVGLSVCDIRGSISNEDQSELIKYLLKLWER